MVLYRWCSITSSTNPFEISNENFFTEHVKINNHSKMMITQIASVKTLIPNLNYMLQDHNETLHPPSLVEIPCKLNFWTDWLITFIEDDSNPFSWQCGKNKNYLFCLSFLPRKLPFLLIASNKKPSKSWLLGVHGAWIVIAAVDLICDWTSTVWSGS